MREALSAVSQDCLPGKHHFYVTIATNRSDVKLSPDLLAKYPDEITLALQHQFWDLEVYKNGFSVSLSFDKTPQRISASFAAVRAFIDPYAQFALPLSGEIPESPIGEGATAFEEKANISDATASNDQSDGKNGGKVIAFPSVASKTS